jgi:predicted AlkP superfamily phosphohydrolase/phosphomutase
MTTETPDGGVFVLGFDGIPWNLIERWSATGDLPSFARLLEEGAAGPLTSTTPPTTPLAWPSIATGVFPDGHGIYGFRRLTADHGHRMNTSTDVRQPELWDVLSPAVVGNVPMTYPPTALDGRMVSGMMTPSLDERFTHPESLADEIRERIPDYRIGLDWSRYHGREAELVDEITSLVEARRELMRLLMDYSDWRLFFFVYTAPDRLQHLVWEESTLLEHYRLLDDVLGEVLDHVSERDATLYVVSDHGFGPLDRLVSVNTLLEREGYLSRRDRSGTRSVFARAGLTKDRVRALIDRLGVDEETLVDRLPGSVVQRVATSVPGDHGRFDVDFGATQAFLYGEGGLYVNDTDRFEDGCVSPREVPAVKREVTGLLSELTDPATGEPALFVHDGDELLPTDETAPDLVVASRPGYEARTSLGDEVFSDAGATAANHRPEGVFLAWGPDVQPGATPEDASVVDVAPTVLHGLGEPVPEQADGRVLSEVFAPESSPATRPVRTRAYVTSRTEAGDEDDFDSVEQRLRGLGYLD